MQARRLKHCGFVDLPNLIFMTDSDRVDDPVSTLRHLPRGTMVVFRDYEAADRERLAQQVVRAAKARGLKVLIAGDWRLAWRLRADGVHLPEHMSGLAGAIKMRRTNWVVTSAAHSATAAQKAARAGVDAVLLSPVFPTQSHIGAPHLGRLGLLKVQAQTALPIFALGGVNSKTARRLHGTRLQGFAAIEGLMA